MAEDLEQDIEVYQLMSTGVIVSLGGSAQAESEAALFVEMYPNHDYHLFFGRRIIAECDPPLESRGRDDES